MANFSWVGIDHTWQTDCKKPNPTKFSANTLDLLVANQSTNQPINQPINNTNICVLPCHTPAVQPFSLVQEFSPEFSSILAYNFSSLFPKNISRGYNQRGVRQGSISTGRWRCGPIPGRKRLIISAETRIFVCCRAIVSAA